MGTTGAEAAEVVSALDANALLMKGDYDAVIALRDQYDRLPTPEFAETLTRAYKLNADALGDQANLKTGDDADQFFEQAFDMYGQALSLNSEDAWTFNGWGVTLTDLGRTKEGEEAVHIFEQAAQKLDQAVSIDPQNATMLDGWSIALTEQAKIVSAEKANSLFDEAADKSLQADEIDPGYGSYSLACISALRDDETSTQKWLLRAKDTGKLPNKEDIIGDTDLDAVKETEWFKEMIADE